MRPDPSIPDLEAEERATYYTASSMPADSAALYEAVNAYVDVVAAFIAAPGFVADDAVTVAHRQMIAAAQTLAQTRYERRRAQQTETGQ